MITVYLDSQDFSHFSIRHKDHEKYVALKDHLLKIKKTGRVRFVFSDVHIYEVYPKDGKATIEGLERIRTMAEFCGKDSLPSFSALLEHEVAEDLCKRHGDQPPQLSTNWFPDLGLRNQPLARPQRGNRAERRGLDRTLRRTKSREAATAEFRQIYPFLKRVEVFLRYYAHQAEWEDVVRMLEDSLQDIESLSLFLASSNDCGLDLPDILRSGYESYVNTINSLRDEVVLLASAASTVEQKSELSAVIDQELTRAAMEIRASIVPKLMADLKNHDPERDRVSVNSTMPCFDALIRYLAELIRRSSQISTPRKPSGSDFADALHVTYFPLVDVFRTDAAAADALKRLYPHRRVDVIGDIFQLPNRILGAI
ncbi:hypothetical protein [Achromobacter sp. NCFB-sbj8-Ac1-l]|uniref:hypothetical protein n=1 Tax=unclassified Achromobacter TaxID=2626865 RepID=UPI004046C44C